MARHMTIDSIMNKLQGEITRIWKMKPEEMEARLYKAYLDKARTLAYLAQVAASIIEKHELEKRLDAIEKELEKLEERRSAA